MKYEVEFSLGYRTYEVEAENEKEAEEEALANFWDDIRHNITDLITDTAIKKVEKTRTKEVKDHE